MNRYFQPFSFMKPPFKRLFWVFPILVLNNTNITPVTLVNPLFFKIAAVTYNPPSPPDRGAPGNRGEGGSRGQITVPKAMPYRGISGCQVGEQSLIALMPIYRQILNSQSAKPISITHVWGLTSVEHPTFWFSVPYNPSFITKMEFVLQNEQNKTIFHTPVTIPKTPGIISFSLPSNSRFLELGKNYYWSFKVSLACEQQQLVQVDGWVQRTKLNTELAKLIQKASPQQKVTLYATNGIWFDSLTTLAQLRLSKPKDSTLIADWESLLQSVGLENIATQLFVKRSSEGTVNRE